MVSLDFLEEVEIFKGLDDERLAALQACCEEVEFQKGDELFAIRGDADDLWAVEEGDIRLTGTPPISAGSEAFSISFSSAGGVFGWSSMVPPYRYAHSAVCVSRRCRLIRIQRECLARLFEADPELGYRVMSRLLTAIGRQFHTLQEELVKHRGQDILNQW